MAKFEVANLCNNIRLIEAIPTSENTFTDPDLVELMSLELLTVVVPLIKKARADFFTVSKVFTLTDQDKTIDIPPEAVGLSVRSVMTVHPDGLLSIIPLLDLTELPYNRNGYVVKNNKIIIYADLPNLQVQVDFYTRPASLSMEEYGKVVSKQAVVNPGDTEATLLLDQKPLSWQATPKATVISKLVPFVTKELEFDFTPGLIEDTTITVPIEVFNNVAVGDYICTPDYAPVIQYVPVEAYHLIVQLAAIRCLESLGDKDGWKVASATGERMKVDLIEMILPRTETQVKKIVNRSGISSWR